MKTLLTNPKLAQELATEKYDPMGMLLNEVYSRLAKETPIVHQGMQQPA